MCAERTYGDWWDATQPLPSPVFSCFPALHHARNFPHHPRRKMTLRWWCYRPRYRHLLWNNKCTHATWTHTALYIGLTQRPSLTTHWSLSTSAASRARFCFFFFLSLVLAVGGALKSFSQLLSCLLTAQFKKSLWNEREYVAVGMYGTGTTGPNVQP